MKKFNTSTYASLFLSVLTLFAAQTLRAQDRTAHADMATDTLITKKLLQGDTVIVEDVKTGEKRKVKIFLPGNDQGIITIETTKTDVRLAGDTTTKKTTVSKKRKTSGPIYGITFTRIDLGLTKPMDGGSFAMSGPNDIFKYRPGKTVNFGFDFLQAGYRFDNNFRMFLSGGIDWTYIRLRKDLIFDPETSPYQSATPAGEDIEKNRLTSTYLRLPLTFEFRSNDRKTKFAFGPMAGFLLKGTQRYKLENGDKIKRKDDFGYTPFQYGAFARFGVGSMGIYGKYYFNNMFEGTPAGTSMNNFTFGLSLGF